VLAATVWVGGQLTLAALVPALRALGREPTNVAAGAFNPVGWAAFGVLVITGVWNVLAEREHISGRYKTTLVVKICPVAASGLDGRQWADSGFRWPPTRRGGFKVVPAGTEAMGLRITTLHVGSGLAANIGAMTAIFGATGAASRSRPCTRTRPP